jgi:hypothetical protein
MFTSNGRYKCYGFILSRDSRKKINRLISLTDKSDSISKPEDMILGNDKWYGALYYKIIPTGNKSSKYYTLLGWHGNNKLTRRKVIESLTFDKEGNAVFGAPIFMTENAEPKRIVFEYSANASMSLKYEPQYYNKIRGQSIYAYDRLKNKKSRGKLKINPKKKRALMIVFDRLMPLSAGLAGQHQFYVATTDYVDGYIFRRGKWRLIYDIDARNSKSR